jgi:polyisoprenyl-phosphate glycosyltransferase
LKKLTKNPCEDFDLSVVIPCFNEEQNIAMLALEIHKEFLNLKIKYEILFVDDGSQDSSASILRTLSKSDERISFLILKRNNGHQAALTAGIKVSRGKAVIAMDADFQHSPRYLTKLYNLWLIHSLDVIQTKRRDFSSSESILKKNLSRLFYKFVNLLFTSHIVEGGADFRLIGPKVIDEIKKSSRTSIFHRGFCARPIYSQYTFDIDVDQRRFGLSKYTFLKQLQLGLLGIIELMELNSKLKIGFNSVEVSEYHAAGHKTKSLKAS